MERFKLALGVMFLLVIHYVVISRLLITKSDLTKVDGIVCGQQLVHVRQPKSVYDAYLIVVGYNKPYFAIQDNKDRAFKYLSTHNINGAHVTILYDADGHSEDDNITYHVYGVTVNGYNIMNMNEAKYFYYYAGLPLLVLLDIVYFFSYRRLRRKALQAL